jgi:hypothetical protein
MDAAAANWATATYENGLRRPTATFRMSGMGHRCRPRRRTWRRRRPPKPLALPAAHADPDNLRTLTAMIDTPVQRAESAISNLSLTTGAAQFRGGL